MKKLDRLEMMKEAYSELVSRLCDIRTMFNFTADSDMIEALIYEENPFCVNSRFSQKPRAQRGWT